MGITTGDVLSRQPRDEHAWSPLTGPKVPLERKFPFL